MLKEDDEGDKKLQKAKDMNNLAMANLAMSLQSASNIALMYEANSKEWPDGIACKAIASLMADYQPDDYRAGADRQGELNKIKMRDDDHPKVLLEEISKICNKYVKRLPDLTESEKIALIIDKAPENYQPILASEQRSLKGKLTAKDLIAAMKLQYRGVTAA